MLFHAPSAQEVVNPTALREASWAKAQTAHDADESSTRFVRAANLAFGWHDATKMDEGLCPEPNGVVVVVVGNLHYLHVDIGAQFHHAVQSTSSAGPSKGKKSN